MNGKRMYEVTQEIGRGIGNELPEWDELCSTEQAAWDLAAFDQDLCDRELSARFHELQKGGKNADSPQ